MSDEGDLRTSLVKPHLQYAIQANFSYIKKDIYHLGRIQRAVTRRLTSLSGCTYEEWLKALSLQFLEKRRLKNDMAQTNEILYNRVLQKPELGRSSLRMLHQNGRTWKRGRNSFACMLVNYWNRLPLAVASAPEQRAFKKRTWLIHTPTIFAL